MSYEEQELDPDTAPPPLAPKEDTTIIPADDIDLLDMDSVLAFTQKTRVKVIRTVSKMLGTIEDPAMISAMLKAASDMDKGVVNRRRVGIEEESAKTADQQSRDTAGLLRAINANMFRVDPSEAAPRPAPTLPPEASTPELVPGETDQGEHKFSYEGFAKDHQKP